MKKHILRVCVCLAVTCYLHFWQNDRDLLCATAVTWGWNGHWNKSQHIKLTLENKIPSPLLPGVKPTTCGPWAWCSTTELSTLPRGTSIFSWPFLLTPTYSESNTPPESKHKHKAEAQNHLCSHQWLLELIGFDASHKEGLTETEGFHQRIQGLLELGGQSWCPLSGVRALVTETYVTHTVWESAAPFGTKHQTAQLLSCVRYSNQQLTWDIFLKLLSKRWYID